MSLSTVGIEPAQKEPLNAGMAPNGTTSIPVRIQILYIRSYRVPS